MPRIFLGHSSNDNNEATALRQWLIDQRPELVTEIFLDIAEDTGRAPGQRWKDALRQANQRCEAVICLVSHSWGISPECKTEYRTAETLGKQILVARLEDTGDSDTMCQVDRQHEPRAVARVGRAGHRLHSRLPGPAHPVISSRRRGPATIGCPARPRCRRRPGRSRGQSTNRRTRWP